ncbi:helix-turn-helix domain-containing protein [uncultured Tateyamaria sp.]|uniref:helix-turn-helix domain-containing protein n=1 Tax=uncultured Tateyamaria sp. TaxID=455651 RepID=UPI002604AEB6|nr:helix-turn-helix domain-containing protein [uncultured Tateyamaria sp.]
MKRNSNPTADQQPKLVVDKSIAVPPPFESDLASASLTIASNDPTDGYPLLVRAHFQPQYITINAGETEIRAFCEVLQASVRLQFVNCHGELSLDPSTKQVEETQISEVQESTTEEEKVHDRTAGLGGRVSVSMSDPGSVSVSTEATRKNKLTSKEIHKKVRSTQKRQVRVISTDHLHIGRYSDSTPLDGVIVDNLRWLYVTPNSEGQRSGVLSRLTVRETWMRFKEVTPRSGVAKLGKMLAKLGNSNRFEDRFRKIAFEALLRHLVKEKLQNPSQMDEATLAIHAVAVAPDRTFSKEELTPILPRERVQLDPAPLEEILLSDIGKTVELLRHEGVDAEAIREVEAFSEANQQNGSPESAIDPARSAIELVGSATLNQIIDSTTDVVEKMCIETALELTRNNRTASAEMLGISRSTLYSKLRKYGITPGEN